MMYQIDLAKLFFLMWVVCFGAAQAASNRSIDLQRADGSIASEVEYQGDYYFGTTGEEIKVFRKKGVYALPANRSKTSEASLKRVTRTQSENWISVNRHNLPGAMVIRAQFDSKSKGKLSSSFRQKPLAEMQPVFTTATGNGDLLLLNKITLSLNVDTDQSAIDVVDSLSKKYGIEIVRQLRVSGYVYSVQPSRTLSIEDQFLLVRRIAREGSVLWAEPQFYMQAQRQQTDPPTDNPLFEQQWHLNNGGYRGSRCDADCDAPEAWALTDGAGAATGDGIVVAVIDDGVQTNHPDLNIASGGIDFVDDGDDPTLCGHDGQDNEDNDPNPSPDIGCVIAGDQLQPDDHGTAVAGIIGALNNDLGGVGVAYNAQILPVRAFSEYDVASLQNDSPLCDRLAQAVEFGAQRAHVINLSWSLPINCMALTTAIENATTGNVTVGDGSLRAGGSPVVVASGNNGSGWVKVTTEVTAGEHAYEWRYLRSAFPSLDVSGIDETVWLDDITWPDGTQEGFEVPASFDSQGFTTEWTLNQCDDLCQGETGDQQPIWDIQADPEFARSGSRSARILAANLSGQEHFCGNSYLHTLRDDGAGEMSFWVWVSANTQDSFDRFEFLVDGVEVISYGDLGAFGFVDNNVAYPANLSDSSSSSEAGVIAVGASTSGDLSGNSNEGLSAEYRASYSQHGEALDVVAPAGGQHLGLTTTDRFSSAQLDTLGLNTADSVNEIADTRFTQLFTGTSASAAIVSGISAALIATDETLTAQQVKDLIKSNADQIGGLAFVNGRNNQVGHGRVNMYKALRAARSETVDEPPFNCQPQAFDYQVANDLILPRFAPQASAGFCPAQGPLPVTDEEESCFVVGLENQRAIVFCL